MYKPKKVVIKIHDDGQIEVVTKDKDIIVEIQAPDGSKFDVEDLKGNKLYGKDGELPLNIQKRIGT